MPLLSTFAGARGFGRGSALLAISNSYELLETALISSNTSTVTFSNLNSVYGSTYQHLQLRITMRSTRNATDSLCYLRLNSDTGSNYSHHHLRGTGVAVQSEYNSSAYPSGILLRHGLSGATNTSGSFGVNIVDILDPFKSTKNTSVRAFTGQVGTFNRVSIEGGAWINTSIVTTITLSDIFGQFTAGSRFSLYGLRSA